MRELAARSFGGEPGQWCWDDQAGPRPQLLRDGVRAWATLSHSGEHLAAAVASQPIGLDLELPRRPRDVMALARHMFAADEVSRLDETEAGVERERRFYMFWALKEARGKRGGEGLQATQARRISARPGAAGDAEACVWPLGDTGALAVAGWPGLRIQAHGLPTDISAAHWTYVAVD
ncbi:4'-phosphopantetheinyl transferase family protein [Arenimonas daejeonensis]|uniref:4'-phosphopantetheinyl transferase family protein n=1 Tax=Arenimonas daejeonensis TaxID=370777 RepID=UPI0011BF6622|nr:4'-phosphopantetheinyl transferase superfamily protein [Arenimonas daejeonensis]